MKDIKLVQFSDVLTTIDDESSRAWVYLPNDKSWNLHSESAVIESEEVPPELEDEPYAGLPEIAKHNNLRQVIPVNTLQDIVANAKGQKLDASLQDLFMAFEYYCKHDAFIDLS